MTEIFEFSFENYKQVKCTIHAIIFQTFDSKDEEWVVDIREVYHESDDQIDWEPLRGSWNYDFGK